VTARASARLIAFNQGQSPMTTAIADRRTAIPATPPPGWERETPKYEITRDIQPAPKARFRLEPPFASSSDSSIWQYGERILKAGEIVETREWPHASMLPLNYAAKRVLDFFNAAPKSRLPRSPFFGDRVRLDDGLSGPTAFQVGPPQVKPMDLRPVRF
jgi:hypothetical protein